MPLSANTFAFHVTYTCPLTCAHCCFNSSPEVKDSLEPQFILDAIDNLPDDIKLVAFTGGEPFLHGANLVKYVRAVKRRGWRARIVTSAYFGSSVQAASRRLRPMKEVGLDELSISWDDFHEDFVPFERIKNVIQAARDLEISTAISSVQSADTNWTVEKIQTALGELATSPRIVTESSLNLTGRALEKLSDSKFKNNGYLGPCPFVLIGPTMSAKGKLLACCGVIPNTERLVIADAPKPSEIKSLIERSFKNPLLVWLFLRGPYSLMEQIGSRYDVAIPARDSVGGNCEACRLLFENTEIESKIDPYLREKAVNLLSELLLLDSLGFLKGNKVVGLWHDVALTRIDTMLHA